MRAIYEVRERQRGNIRVFLTSPVIYAMVVPLVFVDLCASLYQNVCFPVYGIPRVPRKKYVQWVRRGKGLPWLDRFNCAYCSYANGVAAYLRAVLIETEKYWCPIKYGIRAGFIPPHPQEAFAKDGGIEAIKSIMDKSPAA